MREAQVLDRWICESKCPVDVEADLQQSENKIHVEEGFPQDEDPNRLSVPYHDVSGGRPNIQKIGLH